MKFIYLFIIFLFSFSNCSSAQNADVSIEKSNTITVAWAKGVTTLDPACAVGMESAEVIFQIYEGLVYADPKSGKFKLKLAESYQTNGLVWDFKLKKGIYFHDGTEFDADSVVASFQRQIDASEKNEDSSICGYDYWKSHIIQLIKKLDNYGIKFDANSIVTSFQRQIDVPICGYDYWKSYFNMVQSVKKLGKYRVRIILSYPYSPFLKSLEIFAVTIISKKALAKGVKYLNNHPDGTGPFKFYKKNKDQIILTANNNYWDPKTKPKYKYLVYQTIPDNQQRLLALEGGRIDIAYHLDPMRSLTIRLHPTLAIKKIHSSNIVYMALNTSKKPMSIKLNRLAINYAINRDKIVKLVYQGNALLADTPITPSMFLQGKQLITPKMHSWYEYNPEKAKTLLEESGFYEKHSNKVLKLYVMNNPRPYLPNPMLMANLIKKDLELVGIKVKIYSQDYSLYKKSIKEGKHDLVIHGWIGDIWDPDTFLYGLLSGIEVTNKTGTNYARFMNSEYDQLVKEARSITDPSKRISLYKKALKIFKNEAPWVPFAHANLVLPYSRRIHNIQFNTSTLGLYNLMTIEK